MFMLVVPLVFITISGSISAMSDMKRLGKILRTMLITFVLTGALAFVYVFITVKILPPAKGVALAIPAAAELQSFSTGDQVVKALTVTDFPELISRKNMLPLIIFSIVFGMCVNMIGEKGRIIAKGLDALSDVFIKMVGLLMYYAPIGLGAYFAALVGEHGKELLGSYARACAIYYPLCLVYMFTAFPLYAWISAGKEGVKSLKYVISPAVTAVATQSSIATLPVNLEACSKLVCQKI